MVISAEMDSEQDIHQSGTKFAYGNMRFSTEMNRLQHFKQLQSGVVADFL